MIADAPDHPGWPAELADAVAGVLAAEGVPPLPAQAVLEPLTGNSGGTDTFWTAPAPTQPDHASFWAQVAVGWPAPARAAVVAHAAALSRRFIEVRHAAGWQLRTGMAELLADVHAQGLPVAVVSNTLSGAPHREFLDRAGVAGHVTAQFYSDEEGVRKPNPELARRAVAAVGVDAAGCWFVGDTLTRDVLVARRAGIGAAVLMRSLRVEDPVQPVGVAPDAVVADPVELHALLSRHLGS